eukprot:CAMPEP_0202057590 /NCGR_PEP_ID=MMETSP0963-20130614/28937_1 /ASSEMBLY_ACC=CAM_ASM_000494 /TAXON_ID=4773 /ORGANISM="Schizochytrium aggregatum, Strain ATCC28209" /LENGTH=38 /DNA_ID= /DNA_START= /DNA_END= /DNA_ORIENTATION=
MEKASGITPSHTPSMLRPRLATPAAQPDRHHKLHREQE